MEIIIRTTGERTEKACIKSCEQQGNVHVVRTCPFGEAIRQAYKLALELNQYWTPVIDADVVLYKDSINKGLMEECSGTIFCYDGTTDDKIMMKPRRAGIHIYRTSLLETALKYIDSTKLKPESHVRREMEKIGYPTFTGKTIFGRHDYDQYYKDLWRKSVCQTKKLAKMIQKNNIRNKWLQLAKTDLDYKVILHAHDWAIANNPEILIDARIDYDAEAQLSRLNIIEKREF